MGRRRDTTAWAAVERKVAEEQDSPAARSPAARSLAAAHTSAAAVDTWAAAARWRQCLRDCCVPPGVLPAAVLLLLSLSMVPPSTAPGGGRGGGGGGGKRREERRRDLLRVHGCCEVMTGPCCGACARDTRQLESDTTEHDTTDPEEHGQQGKMPPLQAMPPLPQPRASQ